MIEGKIGRAWSVRFRLRSTYGLGAWVAVEEDISRGPSVAVGKASTQQLAQILPTTSDQNGSFGIHQPILIWSSVWLLKDPPF